MKGVLPQTGFAAVFGPSGSGKTFLCMSLAATIAEGGQWFGHKVNASDVVYVCLEGAGGMKQRAAAWEQYNCRELPARMSFVLDVLNVIDPQCVADLTAVVRHHAVVFIDTLNQASPGADENSSADMGKIINAVQRIAKDRDALVVVVHHTGKDAAKGLRGHSSLIAALDAAIEVTRSGDSRDWRVAKSKDGRDGVVHPFNLQRLVLALDEDATRSIRVSSFRRSQRLKRSR